MMPPLSMPGKAWCSGDGVQSSTSSPPSRKLRMRSPFALAGPHPKQMLCGA